jgi:hypothetical protein
VAPQCLNVTKEIFRILGLLSFAATDFQELYRYLIDDFLLGRRFHKKDFVLVTDFMMHLKMGKRIHLCEYETNGLILS